MTDEQIKEVANTARTNFTAKYPNLVRDLETWMTNFPKFILTIISVVWNIMPTTMTTSKRMKMCTEIHTLRSKHLEYKIDRRLLAYLLQSIQYACLQNKVPVINNATSPPIVSSPDPDTLSALSYIGGFFIRKLRTIKSQEIQSLIDEWVVDAPADYDTWTEMQSRGGLIHIDGVFFNLLLHLEETCTTFLKSLRPGNVNIRTLLFNNVMSDLSFDKLWASKTSELSNESSERLKSALVFKFCSLRSTAYVARFNAKMAPTVNCKPSASLRKQLKGDQL